MSKTATETSAATAPLPTPREPGIWFGLDEQEYHDDPSLGSSDEHKLSTNPSDYWFGSHMNPNRPADTSTPAQERGKAVHALVLYGEAEFDRRYIRGPDHHDGMSPAEKGALTKAANAKAAQLGKVALPAVTYDNVAIASAMMAKNPKLANALVGGLNEVSVFWRDPTNKLPKKARIDCLKPRGVGDLKSLANKYGKAFPRACLDSVRWDRRDIQAKHYLDARAMVPQLVADGCVHGDHDAALLKAVCASKQWAWQWVWWQAEGAPITFSKILSPANPVLEVSAATIAKADDNYIEYMQKFGPHEMWLLQEEPTELFIDELGPYFGRE
jgi:hypothetical protein